MKVTYLQLDVTLCCAWQNLTCASVAVVEEKKILK